MLKKNGITWSHLDKGIRRAGIESRADRTSKVFTICDKSKALIVDSRSLNLYATEKDTIGQAINPAKPGGPLGRGIPPMLGSPISNAADSASPKKIPIRIVRLFNA